MSGHSKWASIKRSKGVADVKRGQTFTKLGRELAVAVREGGANADANPRLRLAVERARAANMPIDTIDRAIKRAAGGGDGTTLEEVRYEGYGPGGAAILVEVLTDNRNRAVAEIRNVFNHSGANLGESGCVAWMFEQRGLITIEVGKDDPDEIGLRAIDAGADDVRVEGDVVEIFTTPEDLHRVRSSIEAQDVQISGAEIAMIPTAPLALDVKQSGAMMRMMERLEDLDDVQKVYTNLEISEEAAAEYSQH